MVRDDDVSRPPDTPPEPPPAPALATPTRDRRKKVILLVEDLEEDRELYGRLLWYNGYEVAPASDGEAAIARARELRPDLVLLDMMLPGDLDGIAVARRLREEGLDAPIVALTARSEEELGADAREAGIVAFLEKPIDPFAVVREVIRWIGYAGGDKPGDEGH